MSTIALSEGKASNVQYSSIEPAANIPAILGSFRSHAAIVWVLLPAFVLCQAVIPGMFPTCQAGYSNLSFIALAAIVAHHVRAESLAFDAATAMLAPRELAVMRQLGVLASRRQLLLLGLLEDVYLYVNLSFPLMALSCDPGLSPRWVDGWRAVPVTGTFIMDVLQKLRFWGLAAILIGAFSLAGLVSFLRLIRGEVTSGGLYSHSGKNQGSRIASVESTGQFPRLAGEVFFSLARFAELATMPSVAFLCEEMGLQRRWTFDPKERLGGANAAMRVREEIALGNLNEDVLEDYELQDQEEFERVDSAGVAYLALMLTVKVLIGNGLQLVIQASFLELSFGSLGVEACVKLLAGMILSAVYIVARSAGSAPRLGCLGYLLALLNLLVVLWSGAKVYFTFTCEDHQWNLTSGCVHHEL